MARILSSSFSQILNTNPDTGNVIVEMSSEGTAPQVVTGKYDTSWVTVRTFSTTTPDSANSAPVDGDFVSINLTDGINLIEIYAKDVVCTNAPSAINFGVWVKVGTDTPYLLGIFTTTAGENRASVQSGNAFKSASPIFYDAKVKNTTDVKIAVKAMIDGNRVGYTVDTNAKASSINNVFLANSGFLNTLCTTNSGSGGSPVGIAGNISFYNPTTDAVTIQNASFVTGELLRLPWGGTPNNYFPPLGLSGKVVCADINRESNTINIVGSGIDFRLLCYRQVRFRLSSTFFAISVFPSLDISVLGASVTYNLVNVTGSIGNQTAQLTTNGVTPLTITNQGTGWLYVYPYRDIDNVTINASSQLTIDGNVIDIQNDWNAQTVTVTTTGTAANILHTAHGFSANDAVRIGGSTAPTPSALGDIFYVILVDANNYKLSAVSGGLPIAFTSTGTSVNIQKVGSATITPVTVTAGTPSVISFGASATTLTPHWMGAFQRFTLGGSVRAGAAYTYSDLWVSGTGLNSTLFQSVQRIGMPSVVFETAGTAVTLTASLRYGNMLIERATVKVGSNDDTDGNATILDSTGNALSITNTSSSTCTLQPVNAPVFTSGIIYARAVGG